MIIFSDFSSSDHSDYFDEEQIKAVRLMFFEKAILKIYSLREEF